MALPFLNGIDAGSQRVTNVATPTSSADAVTKSYADGIRTPRASTLVASSNTYTPNADTTDLAIISSPSAAFTVAAPTGTPNDGQRLLMRIKFGGSAFTPTWNGIYQSSGVATLPTSSFSINKTYTLLFVYDAAATKWILLAVDGTGY